MIDLPTRGDVADAARRIAPYIRRTPIVELGNALGDFQLTLKLEFTQVTGSFKPRGAFAFLTRADVPSVGIAAASGGNFGIAAAYAAQILGYRSTIFVPETSPAEKTSRIARYGADVHIVAGFYDDALAECEEFIARTGAASAHAYDHPDVMAGQGTVALELAEQVPEADSVIVAVGGGGLIGGVATWYQDDCHVISAEPETCNSLHASRLAGRPVSVDVGGVAASSLGAASVGAYPWATNEWIDAAVLVDDTAIVSAQRWLWTEARVMVEPAAATTVAALMARSYAPASGERVVAVLSGGNVDPGSFE